MAMLNNQRVYDVIWLWSHKIYMVGTAKIVIFWGWWYDIDYMMMFYTYNQFRGTSIFNPEKPKYHVRRGCLFLHRWDTSQVEVFPTVDVRIGIVEMAQWVFKPTILAVDTPTYVSYICLHDQVELCHILSAYLQSVISFSYPYIAYICVVLFLLVSTWTSPWKKKESTGLKSKLPENQR